MKRSESREQAFLILFEKTFKDETLDEIIESAKISREFKLSEFSKNIFNGVILNQKTIDNAIDKNSNNWKMQRISRVALSILRIAIFEMLYVKSIPESVSINEAVEIAKKYGSKDDASFVNGVLSGVYKTLEKKDD